MTFDELQQLPKIELHCHLDGSLSRKFMEQHLKRTVKQEELSVTQDCKSLEEYLEKFSLPNECLKDREGLEDAGYDILEQMSRENICYAEIRFAPMFSVTETMGIEEIMAALLKGLEKGRKESGVEYNVIACAMRHHSEEENYKMIKKVREFLGAGVCAVDLAGAEAQYPMSEFMELFRKTKELGIPFTIHAGECGNAQNIIDAVHAGARRIGHGIAMRGNDMVENLVKREHIGVEMCPISNLQTKAVRSAKEYPLREFLQKEILVTINTDNRTVSDTSMTKELEFIQSTYGISDEEILLLMKNAAKVSFADDTIKDRLLKKISRS